jgi:hypothetical protein
MQTNEISFYSWVRKGLGSQISEIDNLGDGSSGEIKKRPSIQLTANLETVGCKSDNSENPHRFESKTVNLSGPGDILSLNVDAIARVFPVEGTVNFPIDDFPYVEFWEPDFAWRFTPAKAAEDGKTLRPWLTLVVCKVSECSVVKTSWGTDVVTFDIKSEADYNRIFPLPTEVCKSAHVQDCGENDQICRILGIVKGVENEKTDDEDNEYRAFLIPVFETGRLRGLYGPDYDEDNFNEIPAQKSAWEDTFANQKKRESPFTFPSYYSWTFKRGELSFVSKVRSLKGNDAKKSGINVDVTSLGIGLDYDCFEQKPERKCINMPAALTTVLDEPESAYPQPNGDEGKVYNNLNSLLSKSPVFEENAKIINGDTETQYADEDDPWITPPIYGGKHILATSLKAEDNKETPWLNQVNLDLHYRAAAGLGKKAVQRNQEELVNRAWQQIDAVKTLNAKLNQKMLSANVNDSVKYLNYKWVGSVKTKITGKTDESEFIAQMMTNLPSMRNTNFDGVSLSEVLQKKGIPNVFVSDSFRRTAEKTLENVSYPDFMQSIAEQQIYMMPCIAKEGTISKDQLNNFASVNIVPYLCEYFVGNSELNRFFYWNKNCNCIDSYELLTYLCAMTEKDQRIRLTWGGDVDFYILPYYQSIRANQGEANAMNWFVSNRLWEINSFGYTKSNDDEVPDRKDWNIFALDSYIFKSLFYMSDDDSATVVAIKTSTGWNYYIDRDNVNKNGKKASYYGHRVDGETFEINSPYDVLGEAEDILKLKDPQRTEPFSNKDKWNLCAYCVLFIPDCIVAEKDVLDTVAKNDGYLFENATEFYKKIIGNYIKRETNSDNDNVRLYKAWANLTKAISDIELTPDPKKPEYRGVIPDVSKLKGGLREDSAYSRLKECAATYYSTFFSDDNLIKKYLEDCLASKYPIKAYPIFPEPSYYYLKDIADEFILPGIEDLPDDSISMFKGNAAFIEAYLSGMNTEMGRELLWREYPTDQRGSYFKKFWDSSTTVEDIKKDSFFDVKSLHRWTGNLGENHMAGKGDLLFFAIKGDLMKLYPDTKFTLRKALGKYGANSLEFDVDPDRDDIEPVCQGFVREDVYAVGFPIKFEDALGCPPSIDSSNWEKCGYMLVFERAKENIEFVCDGKHDDVEKNAAAFAINHLDTTSLIGKHVSTLIGNN